MTKMAERDAEAEFFAICDELDDILEQANEGCVDADAQETSQASQKVEG